MARANHGAQIKDDEQYEALRDRGASKAKAARIANTPRRVAGKRGGAHGPYDDWRKTQLEDQARRIGIAGRSKMNKDQLIDALRNH